MSNHKIIYADKQGGFTLPVSQGSVVSIDISDVDLVITTNGGAKFILPNAAYDSMGDHPPTVAFSDRTVAADQIFSSIGEVHDLAVNQIYKTLNESDQLSPEDIEKLEKELEEAKAKLEEQSEEQTSLEELQAQIEAQQNQMQDQADELAAAKAEVEAQGEENIADDHDATVHAPETTAETSISKYTEEMKRIIEETSSKDYDYSAPAQFSPPPHSPTGPPGVPAPLSMTPLVSLSMGNVVGSSSSVSGSTTTIYGGGGEDGSSATDDLGPRDIRQFSTTTITGTVGDDIIYAQGPLLGNDDPSVSTSNYAKQFLLSVAGYFTSLNDIIFTGLPDYVSVTNATKQADGSWVLPASEVTSQQTFELVYDKDAWRSDSTDYFDMQIIISGEMQGATFTSDDTFRFQFMDVTDSSQVADPTLTAWLDSQTKQIYVLPTLDQPNIINHDEGDDFVYGGQSHDTITGGDGNNVIYAYEGDNIITEGNGNNSITSLQGDDQIVVGDGTNQIDAGDGDNIVQVGNGDNNQITAGTGNDTVTIGDGSNNTINIAGGTNVVTVGSGTGNTINTGTGNDTIATHELAAMANFITDTGGNNVISVDLGDNTITTGDGNDTITVTGGSGTNDINAGEGNNRIYMRGTGTGTITVGDGDNILYSGLGKNSFTAGVGINRIDYSIASTALTIDMGAGTAIDIATGGVDVSDTFSNVYSIQGSNYGDTIIGLDSGSEIIGGSGFNTLTGGTGVDYIYGGSGGNVIDGGGGLDFLYGGSGDDSFINPNAGIAYDGHYDGTLADGEVNTVDYSSETEALVIDLSQGTGTGGAAQGSTYEDINHIIGGSGSDTLIASNVDTILEGGAGTNRLTGGAGDDTLIGGSSTDYLTGNGGSNTLIGGAGSNYYYMGLGHDAVVATTSGTWDVLYYQSSSAGIVVNLDESSHVFVDLSGVTRTVAASSGASYLSETDQMSFAVGDTYSDGAGGGADIEMVYGSNYADYIIGNSSNTSLQRYYGRGGHDTIIGSSNTGIDFYYMDGGGNYYDGLNGTTDILYTHTSNGLTVYLDATADIDNNGIADYIDKGITMLDGYAGFTSGWGYTSYIRNIDNLYGTGGGEILVGNDNDNAVNARGGINIVSTLGGDDLIIAIEGNDTIDGGSGTDTISFVREGVLAGYGSNMTEGVEVFLSDATSLDGHNSTDWDVTAQTHTSRNGIDLYNKVTNVENINGSNYADYLAGDAGVNVINGNNGNDWLTGNGGADTLNGGANDDTIVVKASDVATLNVADGGSGTDTLMLTPDADSGTHFTFAADYFSSRDYTNFEIVDARDQSDLSQVSSYTYEFNANDIQALVNNGSSSTLTLRLDTGDVFTAVVGASTGALSFVNTISTATDAQYKYYSDLGNTNLVATLNVHFGVV